MPTLRDSSAISTACMEHQILHHIKQALRVTLDWQAPNVSMPRKLSSLQFTIKSFQRHFDRVISVEEDGGYMAHVLDARPYFQDRIDLLASDHARFRNRLQKLIPELNDISEWEEPRFNEVCGDLRELLNDVDQHDEREIELLQESLLFDDGGEG
jgi:hemerythrin-like domain-containing protein